MLVVTTVYEPRPSEVEQAKEIAAFLQIPYIKRLRHSLALLKQNNQTDTLIVAADTGPVVYTPDDALFFHLGMAGLRIKNMMDGKPDHMVDAMELTEGMSVLDCTLGMGTDAIVASVITGKQGKVIGIEASPLIALITGWGLGHFYDADPLLIEAMRRIDVVSADYRSYFSRLPDQCVDVVYFDPMFRRPLQASSGIRPLRGLADQGKIEKPDLAEALRVAKGRVVIKETRGSNEFKRLGIAKFAGGKYSKIQYGILMREG